MSNEEKKKRRDVMVLAGPAVWWWWCGAALLCMYEVVCVGQKCWPMSIGADDGDTLGVVPFLRSVVNMPPLILCDSSKETLPRFLGR